MINKISVVHRKLFENGRTELNKNKNSQRNTYRLEDNND